MAKFAVIKSTVSKNGGFVNTIECTQNTKVFGVDKTTKYRRLLKTDAELALGLEENLNLNDYETVARTSELDGRVITTMWLHKKIEA